MDWNTLMDGMNKLRTKAELEVWASIIESDDREDAYRQYLELRDENEVMMQFLKKVQAMDEKLDEILKRLG